MRSQGFTTNNKDRYERRYVCPHCGRDGRGIGMISHIKSCKKNPERKRKS